MEMSVEQTEASHQLFDDLRCGFMQTCGVPHVHNFHQLNLTYAYYTFCSHNSVHRTYCYKTDLSQTLFHTSNLCSWEKWRIYSEKSMFDPQKCQSLTPRVSQQPHCWVVYSFTRLPFRPTSEPAEKNRPLESSPFPLPPSLPPPPQFFLLFFFFFLPNLFSGLGFPGRALWGAGNMGLGKHQGSHCRDYNTHISQWQLSFQQMTSHQDPECEGILWHFLTQRQTLREYNIWVFTTSCQFMKIWCLEYPQSTSLDFRTLPHLMFGL